MNSDSQFIATYSNEIIAIILILAVFILYLLIKPIKTNKEQKSKTADTEAATITKSHIPDEEVSSVSQNVGQTESVQQNEDQEIAIRKEKSDQLFYKLINKKREVDPTRTISKDDFKIFKDLEIIVADDNTINQKVITSLLDGSGIKISLADNGQEVLDILEANPNISMILMDAHMPIMDGFEASKTIKQNTRFDNILIIALSGDVAADDIKKMLDSGMQEHLEKPLRPDKLFEILYSYTDEAAQTGSTTHTAKHINMDEGIEICGGDIDLYKDILHEFTQSYSDIDSKVSANLVKDKLDENSHILLDISGIAANIGADTLATIATQYREAIQQQDESQYNSLNDDFKQELHSVLNEIKNQA